MSRPHRFEVRRAHQGFIGKTLAPTFLVFGMEPEEFIAAATIERGEHGTRSFDIAGASRDGWIPGKYLTDPIEISVKNLPKDHLTRTEGASYRLDRYGDLQRRHYCTVSPRTEVAPWQDREYQRLTDPEIFSIAQSSYDRSIIGDDRSTHWAALHLSWKDSELERGLLGDFSITQSIDDESYRYALIASIAEMLRSHLIESMPNAI